MEFTPTLGYLCALLIGVILGLIGGGGSILTVPVFVYLLSINPVTATAYSLFVVGVSALVGAFRNLQKGWVDVRTAIVFAIPAFIAVYIARKFALPAIPDELFSVGDFLVTKSVGIMVFFAFIMLIASVSMIRERKGKADTSDSPRFNYPMIVLEGLLIGFITGLVGAGGGFLIIPALVLLAKLPMKKAVATSLLIIAIKSLIGFLGDVQTMSIDWKFLLSFTLLSVIGIFIGVWLQKFIDGNRLKKAFGWLVLVMGVYIIVMEIT
ncbi:MAG: sulfite exporter TauE/SafE family protein [Bacteroidota bacterium]